MPSTCAGDADGVAIGCRNSVEGVVTRYWGPTGKSVWRFCADASRPTPKITAHTKATRYAIHIVSSITLAYWSVALTLVFAAATESYTASSYRDHTNSVWLKIILAGVPRFTI